MLSSIRRVMEFRTFTLGEFSNAKICEDGSVTIKITQHKTLLHQGAALIVIKENEYNALKRFIKYYRSLVVECSGVDCVVFPNWESTSQ